MKTRRLIPYLELLLAVTFWGGSFVATKVALRDVSPVTIVWLRFGMGVIILGAVVVARRQFQLPARADLGYFALIGFLGITFHQWLQSTGLQTAQATTTAWIVATTPVFMALLGWLALHERLNWIQVGGILLAGMGVLLVVSRGDLKALSAGRVGTIGDLLVLISAPNWAVFSVLSRRGLDRHPAARMMLYVMAFGWVFTSLLFFLGPGVGEIEELTLDGWLGVAFLGVACSGLAYIFWYDGLKALPVAQTGAFIYLEPLVTALLAGLLLGEPYHIAAMIGGGAILGGVWLVNRK